MEFNEKLQKLRKEKGLTQEDLGKALYVSRTAISKWESGRGYPNIDSLKQLALFFSVTVDELLSCSEVLTLAEENAKQTQKSFRELVFGLLDISFATFLFLPLFGQRASESVQEVSLLSLTSVSPWLLTTYFVVVISSILCGVLILATQGCHLPFFSTHKSKISLAFNTLGALLFILSLQPYAATFSFVFLTVKALILIKRP